MRLFVSYLRRGSRMAAFVAGVLVLVACGGDGGTQSAETAPAAPPTDGTTATETTPTSVPEPGGGEPEVSELTIGVIPIAGLAPIHAAIQQGYFEDEGLTVTLETSAGGAASLPLVAQGDLQISNAPPVSVILGRAQGFDFTILPPALDAKDEAPGQTGVLVAADSGINDLADLAGKKVAVNTINSVNWLYNRQLLKQAGVDLDTVTYVEVPFPSMIDALLNGSVDAIDVPQPFLHIAEQTGNTKLLGYTFVDVQPGMHVTAYAASQEWIDAHPNTVAAFARAMDRGVEYMQADDEQAREMIVGYTGAEPDLVAEVPIDSWSTRISLEQVQRTIDLMLEEGLIDEPIDAADIVYPPLSRP